MISQNYRDGKSIRKDRNLTGCQCWSMADGKRTKGTVLPLSCSNGWQFIKFIKTHLIQKSQTGEFSSLINYAWRDCSVRINFRRQCSIRVRIAADLIFRFPRLRLSRMMFPFPFERGCSLPVVGRDYSLEQMYITTHAESLPSRDSLQLWVGLSWRGLSESSGLDTPQVFPLITPAEHTRRKAKPRGSILIKMSAFSVGHCQSLHLSEGTVVSLRISPASLHNENIPHFNFQNSHLGRLRRTDI